MATKVGLAKVWMTLLNCRPRKPAHRCKILGSILNASWVIVIFVWKFPHFRYHGNRGWCDTNFTYTVKSAFPENHIWRKYLDDILYTSWVIADFLMKFTDFCYHGNKGGLAKIWMTPLDWPTPKTPHRWKILGSILNAVSYTHLTLPTNREV